MNGSFPHPSIETLKDQARRLRAELGADGQPITHSKALELLARQLGYKDWNTLHAAVDNAPPACPASLGTRVRGKYLGQEFTGEVIGIQTHVQPGCFRITLYFDEPVDVVSFDSFCNLRRRVTYVIDSSGRSNEKLADGRPHLQLEG